MKKLKLILLGFGNAGQAFAKLLLEKLECQHFFGQNKIEHLHQQSFSL